MNPRTAARWYASLPSPLQTVVCAYSAHKRMRQRHNAEFFDWLERLQDMEWWSAADIAEYQDEELRRLVAHSYETVPYYRQVMRDRRLTPNDIRSKADLCKLPILTREDVRKNAKALVSTAADSATIVGGTTSGSTGAGLSFFRDKSSYPFQFAVWWRLRARFGANFGDKHLNFTWMPVVPAQQARPPYWRWMRPYNQAIIAAQQITGPKLEAIAQFIEDEDFGFWCGYPSMMNELATKLIEAGRTFDNPPNHIFTGSEATFDFQKVDIQALTGATFADTYGTNEGCGNASHCPIGYYHEDFEFGILECGEAVEQADGRREGRILCTGFASPNAPMIRYDIGDIGLWENPHIKCACGRQSNLLVNVEGRSDDAVFTPDGRRVTRFHYIFREAFQVKESQIVQHDAETLEIRLIRRAGYGPADEHDIRSRIEEFISPDFKIDFNYVDSIQRRPNGKYKAVVSKLADREASDLSTGAGRGA